MNPNDMSEVLRKFCQYNNSIKIYTFYAIIILTKFSKPLTHAIRVHLLTNQNSIQEKIKCRVKAENSCYYSVQTLLSPRLLSKNLKIKIYKTIILLVVLYGCETWSLTLWEECRLRVFENRILRRICLHRNFDH